MEIIDAYAIHGCREPMNCLTHLIAAPVFAVLGYHLVRRGRGCWARTMSLAFMAVSSVFLLSMSSIYHLLDVGSARDVLRQLDIAAIFVLIAGTLTPIHTILFRGFNRWAPLLLIWVTMIVGIVLRVSFPNSLAPGVGTLLFVLFGWSGLGSCVLLWRRNGYKFVRPFLLGGVTYTVGAMLLLLHWPTLVAGVIGAHELWHVSVLIALSLHWQFAFQFAAGMPAASSSRGHALDNVK